MTALLDGALATLEEGGRRGAAGSSGRGQLRMSRCQRPRPDRDHSRPERVSKNLKENRQFAGRWTRPIEPRPLCPLCAVSRTEPARLRFVGFGRTTGHSVLCRVRLLTAQADIRSGTLVGPSPIESCPPSLDRHPHRPHIIFHLSAHVRERSYGRRTGSGTIRRDPGSPKPARCE